MRRVIWLQIPTVFGLVDELNIHGANEVRQTQLRRAETLVPEPSAFQVELATEKLNSHKSPGTE
jgi:hypothetical protein